MKIFFRLLEFAKPYRYFWPPYLVVSVLSVIFGVVNFALIAPLLTVLFQPEDVAIITELPSFSLSTEYFTTAFEYFLYKIMVVSGPLRGLFFVCMSIVVTSFLSNLTRFLSQKILVRMRVHIMKNMREALFNKITSMHIGYFNNRKKGDILSTISNDVTEVQNSLTNSFHIVFRDPLLIIGFLSVLLWMSPRLTIVTLLTLPFSAFVIARISRSLKKDASDAQSLIGKILSQFEEAISGARIIKAFNAQKYVRGIFDKTNWEHRVACKKMYYRQEMASPFSEFVGFTIAAGILFFGGYLHMKGQLGMNMPAFVAYIGCYWKVLEPAKSISNSYASIMRGLASGVRIFAILDEKPVITKPKNPVYITDFKDSIEFKGVSFKYDNEPVLKNIDLSIKRGMTVALVGPSGAGKTTMADLIPRYYDVSSGSITIDGHDLREFAPKSIINLMGIVTQDPILFNDTIFNNITFGIEHTDKDAVVRAAQIANAHEFIMQMERGYDTNIGDRGVKLSGGQRQRIAIARAVLKNPPILILDEATSALDTESEKLVQNALTNLMKNRTSVVIAHRLSTIKDADTIVVLKDGSITEQGTHNELMDLKGIYFNLCRLQTFE